MLVGAEAPTPPVAPVEKASRSCDAVPRVLTVHRVCGVKYPGLVRKAATEDLPPLSDNLESFFSFLVEVQSNQKYSDFFVVLRRLWVSISNCFLVAQVTEVL